MTAPLLSAPAAGGAPPAAEPMIADVLAGHVACRTCGARPAPYGFGVAVLRDEPGRWLCATHRAEGARGAA